MVAKKTIQGGVVIMLDGPDGVGKTTQLGLAKQALEAQGYTVHQTRVSGGTAIGEALRTVSLSDIERPPETDMHIALAMYYALALDIQAHRGRGDVCLVDRSPLALFAYQVYGSGLDGARGTAACEEALSLLRPELLISYEAPLDTLSKRLRKRSQITKNKKADYFEQKSESYVKAVIRGYRLAARQYRAITIDAVEDIQAVHTATMQRIASFL